MHREIGAFEAKTKLPELLRGVQAGHSFTITLRGVPIADLVPAASMSRRSAMEAASRMKQFMREAAPSKSIDVRSLINEGRA